MKVYLEQNVFDASIDRLNYIFDEFEHVYLSFSGGKDSSLMIQLCNDVALERGRTFDVLYIDLEAQYKDTIRHVYELKDLPAIGEFYHIALPLNLSNANSIFQTHWTCWGPSDKDKWTREMPDDAISDLSYFDFFKEEMEFEEFIIEFPKWYKRVKKADKVVGLVGIRSDESYNRFRTIAFGKSKYKSKQWITDNGHDYYSAYPIYDYTTEDVWGAVFKQDYKYNYAYELLNKNGVSIHQQRMCQPFGHDQRVSLNQWAILEPDTWSKLLNRVSGANFGALYAKGSLLGHNGTEKPDHMSWEEYAIFLLESLGLYSIELMYHYVKKIEDFMTYYEQEHNVNRSMIVDELTPKQIKATYDEKRWIHWKRIAKMIEKNDFAGRTLSYGITKRDEETASILKEKWGKLLGIQENTKELRTLKNKLYED